MKTLLALLVELVAVTTLGAFGSQATDCPRTNDTFIDVNTNVGSQVVAPGSFGSGDIFIGNNHSSMSASVTFEVTIEYADGMIQQLGVPGSPAMLGPGGGIVQFLTFFVPTNAASGQAVLTCRACATFMGATPSHAFGIHRSTFTVQ